MESVLRVRMNLPSGANERYSWLVVQPMIRPHMPRKDVCLCSLMVNRVPASATTVGVYSSPSIVSLPSLNVPVLSPIVTAPVFSSKLYGRQPSRVSNSSSGSATGVVQLVGRPPLGKPL